MKIARLKTPLLIAGFAAMTSLAHEAAAAPLSKFFDHPFDAVSISQDAAGNMSTTHTVSDGKGHIRTDVVSPSATLTSIFDHDSATLFTIKEKDKTIVKNKLPPNMMEPDAIPKQNLQQLGQKMVNGHQCYGESYHFANTNFTTWRGRDVDNYTVKSTSVRNGVQKVTELKSYSRTPPDPSVFALPVDGYSLQGASANGDPGAGRPATPAAAAPQAPVYAPPVSRRSASSVAPNTPVIPSASPAAPSGATPSFLEPATKGSF